MSSSGGVTSPSIRTPKVPATKPRCIRRLGSDGVWVCLYGVSPEQKSGGGNWWKWPWGLQWGRRCWTWVWVGGFVWLAFRAYLFQWFEDFKRNWNTFLVMMGAQNSESMFCTRLLALKGGRLCAIQLSPTWNQRNVPPNRTHFAVQW